MVWHLRRCENCRKYTLNVIACPYCGGRVRVPQPAKFSPDDKYLKYRMALKKRAQGNEGNVHQRVC